MYLLLKLSDWLTRHARETSISFMRWNVHFFSEKLRNQIEDGYEHLPEWKQTALKDFRFWLEDLPDALPGNQQALMESCDLYTLLSEFSTLRQEIKMQNREQHKTLETIASFIEAYQETSNLFKTRTQDLVELEERIRQAAEKRALLPFFDIRDVLVRGYEAGQELASVSQDLSKSKGLFRSAPRGMEEIIQGIQGMIQGYEIAMRRFDRALELVDIHPVYALGQPFNPKIMKAVGRRTEPDTEKGVVIEEHLSGFIRNDEVIRAAEVIVNV